jgi:hypothetical protein
MSKKETNLLNYNEIIEKAMRNALVSIFKK